MDFENVVSQGLIKTKYKKPEVISQIIPRLRLHEKLNRALKQKITAVSAPAGYGKTTAVLEWLDSRQLQAAWVSLDEKDNESHVFWQYICSALSGIDESIRSDTGYVFSSHELFKTNVHLHILLDKLDAVGTDTFLILDDFHHITEPGILDSLLYFVRYFPPQMHLILISRSEPGMELAHLEVKGQLTQLTVDELRFQHTEISQFYEKRGFYLENSDLESIETYLEGWAAALVVVALSLDGKQYRSQIKEGILNCNKNLDQYFLEEVYNTWTDEKKVFFLQTSILDSLYGSLCNAVTGYDNSGGLLITLKQGNSFLIPLDEKNGWYRYHPIFRNFLFNRLTDSASGTLSDLYKRAAYWYRENGYPRMSIEHYLSGGHYEEALKLIEEQSVLFIDSGDCSSALSWINRLPEAYAENSLEIAAIQTTYYVETGSFELSRHWISRMETIAAGNKYNAHCPGVLVPSMVTIARINKARGDIEGAFSAVEECEARLQSVKKMHWNYLLMAFRVRLYLDSGGINAGEGWFASCKLGIYHEITRSRELELLVYARFLIAQCRVNEAEILLQRLLAFSLDSGRKHSMVEILNLLATASYKSEKNEKAMDYLGRSISIGMEEEYIRSFTDEGDSMAILLSNFTAKGKKQKTYVQSLLRHTVCNIPVWEAENKEPLLPESKQLTRQEYKVLQLLADGYTNQQISNQLNISISTTKIHLGNIYGKLQVATRIQCVNQARKLGLIF